MSANHAQPLLHAVRIGTCPYYIATPEKRKRYQKRYRLPLEPLSRNGAWTGLASENEILLVSSCIMSCKVVHAAGPLRSLEAIPVALEKLLSLGLCWYETGNHARDRRREYHT